MAAELELLMLILLILLLGAHCSPVIREFKQLDMRLVGQSDYSKLIACIHLVLAMTI